ncbi:hypothetical protein C8Q78DRAFT_206415 [Trametes maxima]|nr:hypothetical protein C8Q78DRAFT_206415 [Trametes maxima]
MASTAFHRLPSAIHEEICHQIIHGLPTDADLLGWGDQDGSCRTVAALARTCRFLHEPALNALWRSIPDIACLLFTLPKSTYSSTNPQTPHGGVYIMVTQFDLTGEIIQPDDLERLLMYANRVRILGSTGEYLPAWVSGYAARPGVYEMFGEALGNRHQEKTVCYGDNPLLS